MKISYNKNYFMCKLLNLPPFEKITPENKNLAPRPRATEIAPSIYCLRPPGYAALPADGRVEERGDVISEGNVRGNRETRDLISGRARGCGKRTSKSTGRARGLDDRRSGGWGQRTIWGADKRRDWRIEVSRGWDKRSGRAYELTSGGAEELS